MLPGSLESPHHPPAHSWAWPGPCHPPPQGNSRRAFSSAPLGRAARDVGVQARGRTVETEQAWSTHSFGSSQFPGSHASLPPGDGRPLRHSSWDPSLDGVLHEVPALALQRTPSKAAKTLCGLVPTCLSKSACLMARQPSYRTPPPPPRPSRALSQQPKSCLKRNPQRASCVRQAHLGMLQRRLLHST